jgi:subtilisin family serine protease
MISCFERSRRAVAVSVACCMWVGLVVLAGGIGTGARAQGASPVDGALAAIQRSLAARGKARVVVELAVPQASRALAEGIERLDELRPAVAEAQSTLVQRLTRGDPARTLSLKVRRMRNMPLMALSVNGDELAELARDPGVRRIWEDGLDRPRLAESVPLIGMLPAYELGADGTGSMIAVLDTGVDGRHPFLAGKVIEEACFSTTDSDFEATTTCPNGRDEQVGAGAGVPCAAIVEGCEHGTHVAGIAAGRRASGSPSNGVARGATVFAVQVFSRFDSDAFCGSSRPCALSFFSDQIAGLDHVLSRVGRTRDTIAAVNMSLGGGPRVGPCDSDSRKPAIDALRAAGVATVIAAGNDGFVGGVSAPACISTAVAVASTTKTDTISSFSNNGALVDLLAPGSSIVSSLPGSRFGNLSGTSMATPHVAGAIAAVRARLPDTPLADIEEALARTGTPITDNRGSERITKPRIRVDLALAGLLPVAPKLQVLPEAPQSFTGPPGGPFEPRNFAFRIRNRGNTAIHFKAYDGRKWTRLRPKRDTVRPRSFKKVSVRWRDVASKLKPGRRLAVIKFENIETGEVIKRFVWLRIAEKYRESTTEPPPVEPPPPTGANVSLPAAAGGHYPASSGQRDDFSGQVPSGPSE